MSGAFLVLTLPKQTGKENLLTSGEQQRLTVFIVGGNAKCSLSVCILQRFKRHLPLFSGYRQECVFGVHRFPFMLLVFLKSLQTVEFC